MLERERFSAKTLGKILLHFQNDCSGYGPAGQFWQMESTLSFFNVCSFHRSELGIRWRRNIYSNSCQVPKESANHIIERRWKPVKADKRVWGRNISEYNYQQTGILIPVGSGTLRLFTVLYSNKRHLDSIREYCIKFIIVENSLR